MRKVESIVTNELCKYGCGRFAKYKSSSGNMMCESSPSACPINRRKNSDALKLKHNTLFNSTGKAGFYNYDDLSQETKDRMNWNKSNYSADFSYGGKGSHKQVLIKENGHKCQHCGNESWMGHPIVLELEHIDGDTKNNNRDNLKLLCPNCHSLTPTWRGRNINTGKLKVTDEELLEALSKSKSIRQALLLVGLTPKGGNYQRCNEMIYG